jgi:peroxiredoxin
MALMQTPQAELGWQAPDFSLIGTDNKPYNLNSIKGPNGLLVMFICNHCPYVRAILDKIIRDAAELSNYGIGVVAISSNDAVSYPEDSFDNMKKLSLEKNFSFPYLIDETQTVAKSYDAVCTPDFFGFDKNLKLKYRGRLDSAKKDNIPDAERELFNAMVQIAKTTSSEAQQYPSMGCSIKWKNEVVE